MANGNFTEWCPQISNVYEGTTRGLVCLIYIVFNAFVKDNVGILINEQLICLLLKNTADEYKHRKHIFIDDK